MALSSASPQIANVKDGDKSPPGDLEEGEIEDGELPDEEGEGELTNLSKTKGEQASIAPVNAHRSYSKGDKLERSEKSNEISLGRGSRRKALHHSSDRNNELEEDWACAVEKKLKAAIGKDISNEKVNGTSNASASASGSATAPASVSVSASVTATVTASTSTSTSTSTSASTSTSVGASTAEKPSSSAADDDKRSRRKKRKKKHKEDDEEDRKDTKKRKKSHHWDADGRDTSHKKVREGTEGDEDDDEMLFVRGASPIMREAFGKEEKVQTSKYGEKGFHYKQKGGYDEPYDSYNEEGSDFDGREDFGDETPKRGLGRGAKRRQRTVGRILPHNKRQTRKDTKSKRGGIKRPQSTRGNTDREPNVCMFYMQGKCQKGDDCPYSHNACPPRKMELCKFYLMDCCAKKDKCLYMHHDFPCKFFHTGLKCFSGPRCKFSHGHLSDAMRSILLKGTEGNRHNELRLSNRSSVPSQEHRSKHLETAPKELLGDFPRLSREGAAAMVYNKKNRGNKTKKIPSLFDIEVPIPAQLLAEQKETTKDQSPRRTPMPESDNEDQDGTTTPMPQSPINDTRTKGKNQRWGSDDVQILSKDSKEEENPLAVDDDENKPLSAKFYQETDIDSEIKKKNEKEHGKLNLHRFAGYSPNPAEEKTVSLESSPDKSQNEEKELKRKLDEKSQNDNSNGDSGTESNDATSIPLHLPKKQRELFLRIQQQQREAESSQDHSGDHDDDMDVVPEENWYSSDEEEDSLTNVLKKLSKQEQQNINQHGALMYSSTTKAEKMSTATRATVATSVVTIVAGTAAASTNTITNNNNNHNNSCNNTTTITSTTTVCTAATRTTTATTAVSAVSSKSTKAAITVAATSAAASVSLTTATTITAAAAAATTGSLNTSTTAAAAVINIVAAPIAATANITPNSAVIVPTSFVAAAVTTGSSIPLPLAAPTLATTSLTTATVPPLPLKIPDLSKIKIDESVTKLLSSICGKSKPEDSCVPSAAGSSELSMQTTSSNAARDPRLSRDPRSRSQTSVTSNSSGVFAAASETVSTTSASSSTSTALSSSLDSSRRTDPRRIHDPRSAKSSHKSETHDHKHSGSVSSRRSSSHSSSFPSIYSNAIMGDKNSTYNSGLGLSVGGGNTGDVDLRNILPRNVETGDVDLRNRSDTDLRTGQPPTALSFGDTDLRVRSHEALSATQADSTRNNNDVDLRMLELPFKPVPMHTPATEIEASLTSHPPMPYKVVVVTIPRPDYTSLKLNTSDPQVQSDPRLRKIFKLQTPALENPIRVPLGSSVMTMSRNDPRRQPSRSSGNSSSSTGGTSNNCSSSNNNNNNSNGSVMSGSGCGSSSSTNTVAGITSTTTTTTSTSTNSSSGSVPASTEHEHVRENFSGLQPPHVIPKPPNEMCNPSPLLLPNIGMHPIATPSSSPLLPNPTPRIGRDPRSAPGLLGPAPLPANYCPNTPIFEEQVDLASGMDNDPRVMFSRGSANGARWEQPPSSGHLPRSNWRNNRRNQQPRYVEQEYNPRSYTPPI